VWCLDGWLETSLNRLMPGLRHFLSGEELSPQEVLGLVERARELKRGRAAGVEEDALKGLSVALYFERPSTRTRISFQVGISELGGNPIPLRADELQLGRGESVKDTALMLSRFVHGVVIRSGSDETVLELAEHSEVPVINGLTPRHHPCQALADLTTLAERFEDLNGLRIAYVGDGNNVARSLAVLGAMVGVEVVVAAPEGYRLEEGVAAQQLSDPLEAAEGAHALYTDVWVSMGDEETADARRAALRPYGLREELMDVAADDAVVLHCLPAHPGEEITDGLLYGDRSAVWDQAENRLHAQKALLEFLLAG
jgi:ornithine carbamoyltransferase